MDVSIPEAYCGDDQRPTLGLCAARDAGASKYVLTTWALEDAADAARVLDDAFADLLDKWCEARSKDVTDAATGERVRRRGALPRKIVFWRSGRVGASDYAKIERDEPPAIRLAFERYAASHPDATPVVVPQIAFIATSKSAGVKVTVSFRLKGVAVLELCLSPPRSRAFSLARSFSLSRFLAFSHTFSRRTFTHAHSLSFGFTVRSPAATRALCGTVSPPFSRRAAAVSDSGGPDRPKVGQRRPRRHRR